MEHALEVSQLLNEEKTVTSAGAAYDDIDGLVVPPGHIMECSHVSVENRTTGYTRLLIGTKLGSQFLQLEEQDSPLVSNIYWTNNRILIPPGARLTARCYGCTSGDKLVMNYQGVVYNAGRV